MDDLFLMKRYDLSKKESSQLKNMISKIKKSRFKDKEIYFYINHEKKNILSFYELEKEKLHKVFNKKSKITNRKLAEIFSQIIESNNDLKILINTLIHQIIFKIF